MMTMPIPELLEKLTPEFQAARAPRGRPPVKPGYQKLAAIVLTLTGQHVTVALTVPSKLLEK